LIWFGFHRFLWSAVFSVHAVGSPFIASGPCEDDRGGAERPLGEEGAGQVQRGRHHRRPQEAGGGADRDAPRQDPEVVQHLQGPHHPQGLGLELYYNQPPPLPCCQVFTSSDLVSSRVRIPLSSLRFDSVPARLLAGSSLAGRGRF